MKTIAIEGCDIAVRTFGSGLPLVVIAGGPGLSSEYLAPLEALQDRHKVVLFDQPGCGASVSSLPPTARQAIDATAAVIRSLQTDRFALAAHSWGAYLAAAACLELSASPTSTVLFNPVPLDRHGFDTVGARLVQRVEPEILKRIGELSQEGTAEAGRELMRLAMPAYCGRTRRLPDVYLNYNIATADSVNASLNGYDFRSAVPKMGNLTLVFGSTDYIGQSDFADVAPSAKRVTLDGGHFSMLDSPEELLNVLRESIGT
ncbi:alpha/beta fold hydrolase [Stappia sp.]|uniref:alpha/beta fold hydrolase n=1 Tax=Stappia sp. TaxID=1870903 RepID=UPI003D12731C